MKNSFSGTHYEGSYFWNLSNSCEKIEINLKLIRTSFRKSLCKSVSISYFLYFLERDSKLQRHTVSWSRKFQQKVFYRSTIRFIFISETWKYWVVSWREVFLTKGYCKSNNYLCKTALFYLIQIWLNCVPDVDPEARTLKQARLFGRPHIAL